MALRLRIVSEHATRLGEKATKVFGVHGGTIGRARENEWILPDPERYLSGKHARIEFRAGSYILVDTSSNGTFVNGAQIPLGKFHEYTVKDGDYLRIGEYELLASIDKSNDFPPDDGAIVAYDGGSPSAAVKKSTANDLGADLDLSQLLEPSNQLDKDVQSGINARNAYGQPVADDGDPLAGVEEESVGTPWHMMTRPLKVERAAESGTNGGAAERGGERPMERAAPSAPKPQNPVLYDADVDFGLAAFSRGAGIDPRSIPAEARGAALQLAGQLLREAVLGVMDLHQGRNELRNRFRMGAPSADELEQSLTFTQGGVQDILLRLLSTLSMRAGSVESMRENFRELKAQNTATITAMQAALDEMLARFNPTELEERFERGSKRGVFGALGKGKYWDLYTELYAGLAQHPPDGFPHLFIETFAKSYETKLRALNPLRRGTFSADKADTEHPDVDSTGQP